MTSNKTWFKVQKVPFRRGCFKNFTGINDPYEAPEAPEVHLHTDQQSLEEEVEHLLELLEKQGLIPAAG